MKNWNLFKQRLVYAWAVLTGRVRIRPNDHKCVMLVVWDWDTAKRFHAVCPSNMIAIRAGAEPHEYLGKRFDVILVTKNVIEHPKFTQDWMHNVSSRLSAGGTIVNL